MNSFRPLSWLSFLLISLLSSWSPAHAQAVTPLVMINEQYKLVQLARSQRAHLQYDLRPIQGENLKVMVFRHDQTITDPPIKEWIFRGASGPTRISFEGLPIGVYSLVAYACNEDGEALALAAPIIGVEYGGWRAWEAFKPPVETVEGTPDGFEDVEAATSVRNRDVGISVEPRAIVIKPGQTAILKASFRNMDPEPVKWTLVGEGQLKAGEDDTYLYAAPAKQVGTKLFRVEIQSTAHPELKGGATVLVTDADPDSLNSL